MANEFFQLIVRVEHDTEQNKIFVTKEDSHSKLLVSSPLMPAMILTLQDIASEIKSECSLSDDSIDVFQKQATKIKDQPSSRFNEVNSWQDEVDDE